MINFSILILSGASKGDRFKYKISDLESVTIGRAPDNKLILQDVNISRHHAKIESKFGKLFLVDLNSSHGTILMGFRLKANVEQEISNGDEFKIGDILFRFEISEDKKEEVGKKKKIQKASSGKKKLKVVIGSLIALILMLVYFSIGDKKEFPKQLSDVPDTLNSYKILGYWPSKSSKPYEKDSSHIDLVKFNLPSSFLSIQYFYKSESQIEIQVDGVKVSSLNPNFDYWSNQNILIRDPLIGKERSLVFDNLDYSKGDKMNLSKIKRWAVKNVRSSVISGVDHLTVDKQLKSLQSQLDRVDREVNGVFVITRNIKAAALSLMDEAKINYIAFESNLDHPLYTKEGIVVKLNKILLERSAGLGISNAEQHIGILLDVLKNFDSELWRRYNQLIKSAEYMSENKKFIDAYDILIQIKNMISDEEDNRWNEANRLINDNKFIPKKVRENPAKYRKRKD